MVDSNSYRSLVRRLEMNEQSRQQLRVLATSLLNCDQGITEESWLILMDMLVVAGIYGEFSNCVRATDGFFDIPIDC